MARTPKTWFFTGISRGLGRAFIEALLARGDRVIGTTRDGRSNLAAYGGLLTAHALDVTGPDAVRSVVETARSTFSSTTPAPG